MYENVVSFHIGVKLYSIYMFTLFGNVFSFLDEIFFLAHPCSYVS